jgi:hypothetical protein
MQKSRNGLDDKRWGFGNDPTALVSVDDIIVNIAQDRMLKRLSRLCTVRI